MRDIDYIIQYIWDTSHLRSDVEKQVIVNRLEQYPTKEEIRIAREQLSAKEAN